MLSPTVTRRMLSHFSEANPGSRQERHPGLDQLTERETEVLRLLATGASNKEMARELFVTEATVKTHLAHIFTKLGVDSRSRAVHLARETGLV